MCYRLGKNDWPQDLKRQQSSTIQVFALLFSFHAPHIKCALPSDEEPLVCAVISRDDLLSSGVTFEKRRFAVSQKNLPNMITRGPKGPFTFGSQIVNN